MPGFGGRRGGRGAAVDIWPGWVDALSSLLMVIVFLLLVFVLAQVYLSSALQGRDRQLAEVNRRIAELADMLALERETSGGLRADVAQLTDRLRSTLARGEQLQADIAALAGERDALAAREAGLKGSVESERALGDEARAQVELLNQQVAALREQLARVAAALEVSEGKGREQEAQIADLGNRLNVALADKVTELARYRSEFFGRLREALGERDDVRVVGDRFVFQSEVLFGSGSVELGEAGKERLSRLAETLKEIAARVPPEVDWVLRVDGHTDSVPIRSARFPSNWELSTARATAVVKYLIDQGIPADRLAAAGFGQYQPLDPGTSAEALARNRRIEIKLDAR
ncbi:peptidoglycan -binding protein [Rhodospirillum centenum]|uniref:Chemotaxis MotB protein, putative n=1 Tax=Rhodospirillum centenum (strain ATCC 51521 / SW) TaxID=414684 RepID=B6INN8_RHOCS|nr:peptidoglycan -binding protein [Rhodospirillum centenum]ACI99222.1 chemotaxis MotB protein, putative [Rhodospirillum centenum SW]